MQRVYIVQYEVKEYIDKYVETSPEKPKKCCHCGCQKFHWWGKYERYVVDADAEYTISVRRVCCVKCGRTQSYLPDFCLSRKAYTFKFVMMLLELLLRFGRLYSESMARQIYRYKRRFVDKRVMFVTFLRGRGTFQTMPSEPKEKINTIFNALVSLHQHRNLADAFLTDTGQHFLAK